MSSALLSQSHDEDLNHQLALTYNNLKTGLRSANHLWVQVRKKVEAPNTVHKYKWEPSLEYVKNWLSQQAAHSTHQRVDVNHYFPIRFNRFVPWQRVQMDIFFPQGPSDPCILLCLDTVTRYMLAYPMPSKSGPNIIKAFQEFLKDTNELNEFPPEEIDTDQESGFEGSLKTWCNNNGYESINFVNNAMGPGRSDHLKMAFIDRASRTLRTLIDKYQIQHDTTDWKRGLSDLVYGYNHTPTEETGVSPHDMLIASHDDGEAWQDGSFEDQDRMQRLEAKAEKEPWNQTDLHPGSLVRVPVDSNIFTKRSKQRWKTAPATVKGITNGVYYTVQSRDGTETRYKKYELLPIRASMHSNISIQHVAGRPILPQGGERKEEEEQKQQVERRVDHAMRELADHNRRGNSEVVLPAADNGYSLRSRLR